MQPQYLTDPIDYSTPRRINPLGITMKEIAQCDRLYHSTNEIYQEELFFLSPDRDADEIYWIRVSKGGEVWVHSMSGHERELTLEELQNNGAWWSLKIPQDVKDKCQMV